jgi:hypothetical protein
MGCLEARLMAALVAVKSFICCLCPALSLALLLHTALVCVDGATCFDVGSELEPEISGEFVSAGVEFASQSRVDMSRGIGVHRVSGDGTSVESDILRVLRTTYSVLNHHAVFRAVTPRPLSVERIGANRASCSIHTIPNWTHH